MLLANRASHEMTFEFSCTLYCVKELGHELFVGGRVYLVLTYFELTR